jgi:hypothetical protein
MDNPNGVLRTGDRATVQFEFISNPEYLKEGMKLLFREGKTKVRLVHGSRVLCNGFHIIGTWSHYQITINLFTLLLTCFLCVKFKFRSMSLCVCTY